MRQECEASTSWSHRGAYNEDNTGGWLLVHIGNIMVRGDSDTQRAAAAAAAAAVGEACSCSSNSSRGGGGGSGDGGGSAAAPITGRHGRDVVISFGGENPRWVHNLEVDFAAIAPFRLAWDIERVLMIGNRKGHGRSNDNHPQPEERQEEQLKGGVAEAPRLSVAQEEGLSPLSRLPEGVMWLVLEFSQPTLVRPEEVGEEAPHGVVAEDGHEDPPSTAHWKVF